MQQELQTLKEHSNLRRLPQLTHEGRTVIADGRHMLNLSSNDYLGLAADRQLKEEFLQTLTPDLPADFLLLPPADGELQDLRRTGDGTRHTFRHRDSTGAQ